MQSFFVEGAGLPSEAIHLRVGSRGGRGAPSVAARAHTLNQQLCELGTNPKTGGLQPENRQTQVSLQLCNQPTTQTTYDLTFSRRQSTQPWLTILTTKSSGWEKTCPERFRRMEDCSSQAIISEKKPEESTNARRLS